MPGIIF